MNEPKLTIMPKRYNGESTIISMRLARDLVKDIDQVAALTGRSRSEILTMSLEFALNHMEIALQEQGSR
jgi:predicted transcriptional regulator